MATYTIIGSDGKEYGPVSAEEVRQWFVAGRINAATKIRAAGAGELKSLSEFPEFNDLSHKSFAPPPLPAGAPRAKMSALAITSLVLGPFGLFTCGIAALVGLILGIIAIVKIRNSEGRLTGFGLALAGTIVSAVFLVMLPAVMLLPALAAAKQKAQEIVCVNNEKELALAVRIYAGSHNDQFPHATTWCDDIKADVPSEKFFKCPAVVAGDRCDYAFNAKLDGLDENKIAPQTVMIFEAEGGWNANGGADLMISKPRHARFFVVAYADGSVQQLTESQLGTLRWDP
jgi:Domain of unknown function (DUF4190)/GYF domain 2